jgi:tRNA U34 2-thiouridine synthase MnmA/TrmU
MTVGQRRGVLPGRDGEKRYVSKVDIASQRVEVGTLEQILISRIALDESSLTFSHEDLRDGATVLAQWSAHGIPKRATLRNENGWHIELHEPARPVAVGSQLSSTVKVNQRLLRVPQSWPHRERKRARSVAAQ